METYGRVLAKTPTKPSHSVYILGMSRLTEWISKCALQFGSTLAYFDIYVCMSHFLGVYFILSSY